MSEGARQVRHHSVHIVGDPINQLKGRAASTHQRTLTVIGFIHTAPISDERDDKAGACNRHEAEGKERKTT